MEQIIEELSETLTTAITGICMAGMFGAVFTAVTLF